MTEKILIIFSLILILTKCEKLTKEENTKLKSICGTKKGLLSENTRKVLNGVPIEDPIHAPWAVSIVPKNKNEDMKNQAAYRWMVINRLWDNVDGCEGDDLIVPEEVKKRIKYNFNTICADYACDRHDIPSDLIKMRARKVILPGMCASKRFPQWWKNKDFAIVELKKDLILSDSVFPVCVTKSDNNVESGKKVWLAGYGADPESKNYPRGVLKYNPWQEISVCGIQSGRNDDYWFCTNYTDKKMNCPGDSGAGAIQTVNERTTIIGLMARGTNCSDPENGGNVFVNLTSHIEDVCKYTGVCNNDLDNLKNVEFSIFGIILISIIRMD